ncbi:MAG: hypothetical protein V4604_02530 [Bacteroidota bacterium]
MKINLLLFLLAISGVSFAQRDTLHFMVSWPAEKFAETYTAQLIKLDDENHYELDIIRTVFQKRKEPTEGGDSIVRSYILPPNLNDSNAFRFKCEPLSLGNGQLFVITDYADKQTRKLPEFKVPFNLKSEDALVYSDYPNSKPTAYQFSFEGCCLIFNADKTEGYLSVVGYLFGLPYNSFVPRTVCNDGIYNPGLLSYDYEQNICALKRYKKIQSLSYYEGDLKTTLERNIEL